MRQQFSDLFANWTSAAKSLKSHAEGKRVSSRRVFATETARQRNRLKIVVIFPTTSASAPSLNCCAPTPPLGWP